MSVYARKCDRTNRHLLEIIFFFKKKNPNLLFFIENPRAGLACMEWMKPLERYKHTITYCKYMKNLPPQKRRMKPTDIWTNHPDPKFAPPCNYGDICHQSAPRGSHRGTQALKTKNERFQYPPALIRHIVKICEDF